MSFLKKGARVVYIGTLHTLSGRSGTVANPRMRNGWVGVRFDGDTDITKCAPVNITPAPADPVRDAARDMLAALKDEQHEIAQLCDMVNRFAARLGLGRKVNPVDWGEKGRAAIAKAEGRANG